MQLSVVVPFLNESATLANQLLALSKQEWSKPWEVILADNGSTDGSLSIAEQFKKKLPRLSIIDASDRKGQAYAKNVGARFASGRSIAFCDADDEVAPGWVAAIGEALEEHDFVASRFEIAKLSCPRFLRGRGAPQSEGLQIYRYPPYLPHAGGCGLGIKRIVHEAIGGFDESWAYHEDTDYCFRVQLAGTPLHFAANAVVHIRFPETLWGAFNQARNWGLYNVLIYKRYRSKGMSPLRLKDGLGAWIGLMKTLPWLFRTDESARWLWQFGLRTGRLQGCLKHRVLAL
jgi:glycosyltransferase involved in cell wall biosynthesis